MGSEGGFVGVKLRGQALESAGRGWFTSKNTRVTLPAVVLPSDLLEWCEGSNENTYREMEFQPGYIYGTWGSFQRWDLGDLPAFIFEAREYATQHAGATFRDWIEDLYTHPYPDADPSGFSGFLCEEYMNVRWQDGWPQLESPDCRHDDPLPDLVIAEWIAAVEAALDLADIDRVETWT